MSPEAFRMACRLRLDARMNIRACWNTGLENLLPGTLKCRMCCVLQFYVSVLALEVFVEAGSVGHQVPGFQGVERSSDNSERAKSAESLGRNLVTEARVATAASECGGSVPHAAQGSGK